MNNLQIIRQAAIAVAVATTLGSAVADTLRSGESVYGQPAAAGATARVVDLKATKYANVTRSMWAATPFIVVDTSTLTKTKRPF